MSDLIDRQKALDGLKYEMKYGAVIDQCGLDTAYNIIENMPSAEPEERTAKVYSIMQDIYHCGACDEYVIKDHDSYCSACGAKLDWSGND